MATIFFPFSFNFRIAALSIPQRNSKSVTIRKKTRLSFHLVRVYRHRSLLISFTAHAWSRSPHHLPPFLSKPEDSPSPLPLSSRQLYAPRTNTNFARTPLFSPPFFSLSAERGTEIQDPCTR